MTFRKIRKVPKYRRRKNSWRTLTAAGWGYVYRHILDHSYDMRWQTRYHNGHAVLFKEAIYKKGAAMVYRTPNKIVKRFRPYIARIVFGKRLPKDIV